jgi:hypothetical protein
MTMRRITAGYVRERLRILEPKLLERIGAIKHVSVAIGNLAYIVLDVSPDTAFDRFPVTVATYDSDKHELDSPIHCTTLLEDAVFLAPALEYPIGRVDWIGQDTTPDFSLILDEVVAFVREIWNSDGCSTFDFAIDRLHWKRAVQRVARNGPVRIAQLGFR